MKPYTKTGEKMTKRTQKEINKKLKEQIAVANYHKKIYRQRLKRKLRKELE